MESCDAKRLREGAKVVDKGDKGVSALRALIVLFLDDSKGLDNPLGPVVNQGLPKALLHKSRLGFLDISFSNRVVNLKGFVECVD